jgi:hypothetical protein
VNCYCCEEPVEMTRGMLAYCEYCDVFIRFHVNVGTLEVAEVYTLTEES